jgi:hypothetical protein
LYFGLDNTIKLYLRELKWRYKSQKDKSKITKKLQITNDNWQLHCVGEKGFGYFKKESKIVFA